MFEHKSPSEAYVVQYGVDFWSYLVHPVPSSAHGSYQDTSTFLITQVCIHIIAYFKMIGLLVCRACYFETLVVVYTVFQ